MVKKQSIKRVATMNKEVVVAIVAYTDLKYKVNNSLLLLSMEVVVLVLAAAVVVVVSMYYPVYLFVYLSL